MTATPNIILVVLDTMRAWSTIDEVAPILAEFGHQGTMFKNAFSTAPWTVPSHGSLFTGTYPSKHGTHGEHPSLGNSLRTLPESFAEVGYETIGFSNNTWITHEFNFDRGFEQLNRGWQYIQSGVDIGPVVRAKSLTGKIDAAKTRLSAGNPLINVVNLLYAEVFQPTGDDGAARTTERVRHWLLNRDTDRPFFLFINYLEPHIPYDPPREAVADYLPEGIDYDEAMAIRQAPRSFDVGEYDISDEEFAALRGLYRGEQSYVDAHLADLQSALVAADAWEDTIIAVCGDHGENVGDHGFFGHQYSVYDTVLRVPLVIVGGLFDANHDRDGLVQLLDLPVTLLDAAGIDAPLFRRQQQGRSLHPYIESDPREAIYAEYLAPQPPLDVLESRFGAVPESVRAYYRCLRTVRTKRWKYIRGGDGTHELYRIDRDPRETTNRVDENPEIANQLMARLDQWLASFDHADTNDAVEITDSTLERLAELGYR